MSNVVSFKPDRTGRTERSTGPEDAQILFFTGVRYVRLLDPEETADALVELTALEADREAEAGGIVERLQA